MIGLYLHPLIYLRKPLLRLRFTAPVH